MVSLPHKVQGAAQNGPWAQERGSPGLHACLRCGEDARQGGGGKDAWQGAAQNGRWAQERGSPGLHACLHCGEDVRQWGGVEEVRQGEAGMYRSGGGSVGHGRGAYILRCVPLW